MQTHDSKEGSDSRRNSRQKSHNDKQKQVPDIIKSEPIIREISVSVKMSEKISYSEMKNMSIASSVGLRDYQEDFCSFGELDLKDLPNGRGHFMAVFDGHGGPETSKKASESVLNLFGKSMIAAKGNIPEALEETVKELVSLTAGDRSGSTLSLVYIPSSREFAHAAVLGDSPVIVFDKRGKVVLSPEHNARSNLEERNRAIMKGADFKFGYLFSANGGGLQLSRALGNNHLSDFLGKIPEIYSVPLGEKSFVVVGSDGLFDPNHKCTLVQCGRISDMLQTGANAKELVRDALERCTKDNVTAMVWRPC